MRAVYVFAIALIVCLTGQVLLAQFDNWMDLHLWITRAERLAQQLDDGALDASHPDYSGHPGMPIVTGAALLHQAGVDAWSSVELTTGLLVAVALAAATTLAYLIAPRSPWWWGLLGVTAVHPLYQLATPTNVVAGSFVLALALLTLFLLHQSRLLPRHAILVGVLAGLLLATRSFTGAMIVAPLLLVLTPRLRWRGLLITLGTAAVIIWAVDPLLWYTPLAHAKHLLGRNSLNFTDELAAATFGPGDLLLKAPAAVLSLLLVGLAAWRRQLTHRHGIWLAALAVATLLLAVSFWSVQKQSPRHWVPLILLWEALLPWLLWRALKKGETPTLRLVSYLCIVGLIGLSILPFFLTWYTVAHPHGVIESSSLVS